MSTVSVVIPVYNSGPYLRQCLESVVHQPVSGLEILAVDDGSTDESSKILEEYRLSHGIRVITQENSGSPGGARNPGIEAASGDFVFFLDSDDTLTPGALVDLVAAAEINGADVVLGRLGSHDHRTVPTTMFRKTLVDADLIEDNVFNTLGPTKLFRRSLIEEYGVRFHTDLKVGEDQPFVAAMYLRARRISVLSDRDYYLVRRRDDGSNMTSNRLGPFDQLRKAVALASSIAEHASSDTLRDRLMYRPFGWSMNSALDRRFLTLSVEQRKQFATQATSGLKRHYTSGVESVLPANIRVRMSLLFADEIDALGEVIEYFDRQKIRTIRSGDGYALEVPERIAQIVPGNSLTVTAPSGSATLTKLEIHGDSIQIGVKASFTDYAEPLDWISLHLDPRDGSDSVELETEARVDPQDSNGLVATARLPILDKGIWDLFAVFGSGENVCRKRVGAQRARSIPDEAVSNVKIGSSEPTAVVAYFTEGYGNLSFDVGAASRKPFALCRAIGMVSDEDGRCQILVQTFGSTSVPEFFSDSSRRGSRRARHLLPTRKVGLNLLAVRLPVSPDSVGTHIQVDMVDRNVRARVRPTSDISWTGLGLGVGVIFTRDGTLKVVQTTTSSEFTPPQPVLVALGSWIGSVPVVGDVARKVRGVLRRS